MSSGNCTTPVLQEQELLTRQSDANGASSHIRSQGVAWSLAGTFLSTLVYVEAAPTALANIKWKYYIIFVCLTFVNILIFYFWCPEVCQEKVPKSGQGCVIADTFLRLKASPWKKSMRYSATKWWSISRMQQKSRSTNWRQKCRQRTSNANTIQSVARAKSPRLRL